MGSAVAPCGCLRCRKSLKALECKSVVLKHLHAFLLAEESVPDVCAFMPTGLVFFAFAFNMVDTGGLLGQRLGNPVTAKPNLKKVKVRACCCSVAGAFCVSSHYYCLWYICHLPHVYWREGDI